jgi:hypothetical protein
LVRKHDQPRTTVTGGISQMKPYVQGECRFNVAAIGMGPGKRGLLKSLREDGSWEGSVYSVPFRTAITVQTIAPESVINANGVRVLEIGPLQAFDAGEQVVVNFTAQSQDASALRFNVRHQFGGQLPGYGQVVEVESDVRMYRFVLRSQLPVDGLILSIEVPAGVIIGEVVAQRQTDEVARPHRDDHEGVPHQGGVTFDLL